jgi:hypothetical protein
MAATSNRIMDKRAIGQRASQPIVALLTSPHPGGTAAGCA